MMQILREVNGLFVGPISDGTDKQNKILCEELEFKVLEYKSGITHNGWTVPQKWEVKKAEIRKNGRLIYDGAKHPLGVIGYSDSFIGKINLEELKKHLFYKKDAPNNIVYHCDLYYKPHIKLWGFSIPYSLYQNLEDGEYEINLETTHTDGIMKVLEYAYPGESEETIILNAHNCHAAQSNDGPSGYAMGIEIMRRLARRSAKNKYIYKLIIAPEHFGTIFYTANLDLKILEKYKYCIFLEMLGNDYHNFALHQKLHSSHKISEVGTFDTKEDGVARG
jgi:aminopeptidase-like protein